MKNNLILIVSFFIAFLLFDFLYLWVEEDIIYSIKNFVFTSFFSLLYYRLYLLIILVVVANVIWFCGKYLKKDLTNYILILIFLFFLIYSMRSNNYFFIIPSVIIPLFIKSWLYISNKSKALK